MSDLLRQRLLGVAGSLAIALGLGLGVAGTASAAPMFGSIPDGAVNDALQPLFGADSRNGWYGATLYLVGGPADIEVSYLGAEAGYTNSFTIGGGTGGPLEATTPGNSTWTAGSGTLGTLAGVGSGELSFSFTSGGGEGTVSNGDGNENSPGNVNFFVSFQNENAAGGQIAYLFLDDAGAGDDDNHDDMVIRLSTSSGTFAIPLPAAAWLMIAGIGGLGLVARRRKVVDA